MKESKWDNRPWARFDETWERWKNTNKEIEKRSKYVEKNLR